MRNSDVLRDYRDKIVSWIAGAALLFILPFTLNNLYHGRWLVGMAALFVLCVLVCNVVAIRTNSNPKIDMLALLPAISAFLALCFLKQGVIAVFWSYPAIILFYFLLPPPQARLCNATILSIVVPASFSVLNSDLASRVTATLLAVSVLSGIFIHLIWLQQRELERQAVTDPLTQVYNRLQLEHILDQAQSRQRRYGLSSGLLALDIDHFKSINDTFGHAAGDRVLKSLAALLRRNLRASDCIFRTGGEEFLVLLEGAEAGACLAVAEKFRRMVEELTPLPGRPVTVSIGLSQLHEHDTLESWMKRADQNLYLAKEQGRNRVITESDALEGVDSPPQGHAAFSGVTSTHVRNPGNSPSRHP